MSKYSYVELIFESQRVDIINNNQFQTTITFRGTGDQSKLLSVIISSYNRIKNDLYHSIHNFSVYQNDINKISDNGKFYKEINILESEISNPIKLLLNIFNKVTTTNLINNTDNYNEMSEGTFSTKLFTTQIKNIKSTTPSVTTTVTTTPSETIPVTKPPPEPTTGTTTPPVTTTVTTTTPQKPSNTAAEATGGAVGGGLASAKVAVTILKKNPNSGSTSFTIDFAKKPVGAIKTGDDGSLTFVPEKDIPTGSTGPTGKYDQLYQYDNTKNLGSAYFNDDMQKFALEMDESLKLVKRIPSQQGNPLYKYENPENGNEIFALDQNASPSQLYANANGEFIEISPVVNSSGEEASVNGDTLYETTDGEYLTLNNDGTVTLNQQELPQQYANVNGEYVKIDPVMNSSGEASIKGNTLYETSDGDYVTFNNDGTVNLVLTGNPENRSLTLQSINGSTEGVEAGLEAGDTVALDDVLIDASLDVL
jgi:hypothetical protein